MKKKTKGEDILAGLGFFFLFNGFSKFTKKLNLISLFKTTRQSNVLVSKNNS